MGARRLAAIITPYGLFNYGNRLQNWAVNQLLKEQGYHSETLILRNNYPKRVIRDVAVHAANYLGVRGQSSRRYRRFDAFDKQIITRRVWSEAHLSRLVSRYDAFVIGSDQIWNPYQIQFNGAEYARMAPADRILALSASFGLDTLPSEFQAEVSASLLRIEHISVRERAGAEIVRELTGRSVPTLIDPTLALDADKWTQRADQTLVPKVPYTLIFIIGDVSAALSSTLLTFMKSRGTIPVRLYDTAAREYFHAGPQDFLGLIREADSVVTDSYHAVIFSILFGTEAFLVSREGLSYSMSSRFASLSELLKVRFEESPEGAPGRRVTLSPHNLPKTLTNERARLRQYLSDGLDAIGKI